VPNQTPQRVRVENMCTRNWTFGGLVTHGPLALDPDILDNDFFGQPEPQWSDRIGEIREGNYRVNFNQGINIRMITPESAAAIASVKYYNVKFTERRLYTAWDNLGQEKVFFKGLQLLLEAGVPASRVMVYMLIGYKPGETMEEIFYRYRM
jgi:hypothetical protein